MGEASGKTTKTGIQESSLTILARTVMLAIQKHDVQSRKVSPISRAILPQEFKGSALEHIRWYLTQQSRLPKE